MARTRPFIAIQEHLSNLIMALEKPSDLIILLIYCIPVLSTVRICTESGIFERLSESITALSADELAESVKDGGFTSGRDGEERRDFIIRTLRAVCAIGLVDETSEFTYGANELTRCMADPGWAAGFDLVFDNAMGPRSTMSEMVSYHKANGWRAPSSANDGPWQRARDVIGSSTFDNWGLHDPLQLTRLSALMQRMQTERPHWTEWLPQEALFFDSVDGNSQSSLVFVDVGGGRGHDLAALAKKYPKTPMTLILQDLPSVTEEAEAERAQSGTSLDLRIITAVQDFFQPQKVEGADVYYMHKIMHDWPDEDCVRILARLRDAMGRNSRIFINEVILPSRACPLLHAAFDIDMLALHSGQERDEEMWKRVIAKVDGLRIKKFWHAPDGEGEGIVEVDRAAA